MTKDKIISSAESLFAKAGYDGTSLAQIAKKTGIRKPSLYAHFTSKAELFLIIYERTHARTLEQITAVYEDDTLGCGQRLEQIFRCICLSESLGFFRATMFPPSELKSETLPIFFGFENEVKWMLATIITQGQRDGLLRIQPVENIIDLYFYVLDGLMAKSLFYTDTEYEKKVELAFSMFLEGITAIKQT